VHDFPTFFRAYNILAFWSFALSCNLCAQDNTFTETVNGVSFTMVQVHGGTFTMGCTRDQTGHCEDDERPAHEVTLSDYRIGETEVTRALWWALMGAIPWQESTCPACPIDNVTWIEVQRFIQELNAKTGKSYRLPTEAEWEFAARGGLKAKDNRYSGSSSVHKVAWMSENAEGSSHSVKDKKPNELGLYDMSGNVWEWCSDWYGVYPSNSQTDPSGPTNGSRRVARGGGWGGDRDVCRVTCRGGGFPDGGGNNLGFRLASQ
jgi:sulfatase modifying factor 1